jgi:hypothetical protein
MWKTLVFLIVLIALLLLLAKGLRGMWNSWELRPVFWGPLDNKRRLPAEWGLAVSQRRP